MNGDLSSPGWVRVSQAPALPPPQETRGVLGWMRQNLFATPLDSLLTFLLLGVVFCVLHPLLDWALFKAVWWGTDGRSCSSAQGACWPFVSDKISQWIYGFYDSSEHWRVNLVFVLGLIFGIWLMVPAFPHKRIGFFCLFVIYPLVSYFLLMGSSVFSLKYVETRQWGGLLVTLVVAVTGIFASLPLGILLALGRRSEMWLVRIFSVTFIELWRGVPLITVLFMASFMLPLFLPNGMTFDQLLRCLVGVALFSAAYMAEVVRGGLQAVPKGQYEAAHAMGFGYWKTMILIILPQALKIVIPGIVNTFIGLFKDTTLVSVVGLFDLLGIVKAGFSDQKWLSPQTSSTGYFFTALVFWVFCFSMSRYSIFIERQLATGHRK